MIQAKRRSIEKRREISRCAARHRREKEADVFTDLYVTVPIVEEPKVTHVDRIAILRLAASLCRFRQVAGKALSKSEVVHGEIDEQLERDLLSDLFNETTLAESLNGFLLVVDSRSSIIYISPNVSRSLGLTQTDLVGQNLSDFLHPDDVTELKAHFANTEEGCMGKMFLRMKSVLGARGRSLNLRSALYKAISFSMTKHRIENIGNAAARLSKKRLSKDAALQNVTSSIDNSNGNDNADDEVMEDDDEEDDDEVSPTSGDEVCGTASAAVGSKNAKAVDDNYFFLHGSLISQYGNVETQNAGSFVTRHSMEMKFSYCHDRLSDYLGYDIKSLMGTSFYSLVHPSDLAQLTSDFKELYKKGQVCTNIYRLMAKTGGYIWLSTEASVVTQGTRSGRGQHIVCVHQLISAPETRDVLADVQQNTSECVVPMKVEKRAPKTSEPCSIVPPQLRNSDNFARDYDQWLFRGSWENTKPTAENCSTNNKVHGANSEEYRSGSAVSSYCLSEDTDSPDATPPLLLVPSNGTPPSYNSNNAVTPTGRSDCLSSERAPMLLSASSLGSSGTQSGADGNLYATLLDADLSSASPELSDKFDDLSLLAPFVDPAELVALDILAEDLEVPLDLGDFDLSLDLFKEETKVKCVAPSSNKKNSCLNNTKLSKIDEEEPILTSCGRHTETFDDLNWPRVIENLSPMTSARNEIFHNVFHVAIEQPQNISGTGFTGHVNKMELPDLKEKSCESSNHLFAFAHDPAMSNKTIHHNYHQSLAWPQLATTHHNYQWNHNQQEQYKEMMAPVLHNSGSMSHFKRVPTMDDGGHGYARHHVETAGHHSYSAELTDHHQFPQQQQQQHFMNINVNKNNLKALTSFTERATNYLHNPQQQEIYHLGLGTLHAPQHDNRKRRQDATVINQLLTASQMPVNFVAAPHPNAIHHSTSMPSLKQQNVVPILHNQGHTYGVKKRMYSGGGDGGKRVAAPCNQFYLNQCVESTVPPPSHVSNLNWSTSDAYQQPQIIYDQASVEPKIKRFKSSASTSYVKIR